MHILHQQSIIVNCNKACVHGMLAAKDVQASAAFWDNKLLAEDLSAITLCSLAGGQWCMRLAIHVEKLHNVKE